MNGLCLANVRVQVAYALHDLFYIQGGDFSSRALYDTLVKRVEFAGASGNVTFQDSSSHPHRRGHGNRRLEGSYFSLMNYADNANSLVQVGSWTACEGVDGTDASCAFSERFSRGPNKFVYSTRDNNRVSELSEGGGQNLPLADAGSGSLTNGETLR